MYIYKTTNIINNKFYFGKSEFNSNENPEYLGSGILLNKAIKKYGKENFKKEIIEDNIKCTEQLNKLEKYYISNNINENCYNLAEGGNGGNTIKHFSKERLKQFKEKMSEVTTGENNPFYGKTHTDITKNKISNIKTGSSCSDEFKEKCSKRMIGNVINNGRKHNDKTKQKHSENNSGVGNPMFGKRHSEETLNLISNKIKENKKIKFKCEHCGKEVDKGNFNRWHGNNCKILK